MEQPTVWGMDHRPLIVAVYFAFAGAELLRGHFRTRPITKDDWRLDLLSSGIIALMTSPAVVLGSAALLDWLFPGSRGAWSDLPVWAMVLLFLVGDDLTQYAWHRASHSVPFLYTLHRAHHSAGYMSVQMMYRNNLFYYALMPSMWISGALVHLGLGSVYAVYIVVKLAVIAGAHSSTRWDAPLYRIPALNKVMWVVERVISTPSTHSMHHGQHADDGITHYAGNYGNLLFFWDVLFGTARITRRYPETYGIEGLVPQPWYVELAWPLFRLRTAPEQR
jgi:sterol desaturase/sphingolipid hydroxylase (fatty acid hydroxylase superfamily)